MDGHMDGPEWTMAMGGLAAVGLRSTEVETGIRCLGGSEFLVCTCVYRT